MSTITLESRPGHKATGLERAKADRPQTDFARRADRTLIELGGRFMTSAEMGEAGGHVGLPGPVLYFRRRSGPCGTRSPETAAAVLAIFPSQMIRLAWEQTAAVASDAAAAACAGACAAWGPNNLMMIAPDDPARAAEHVIDAAGATGLTLFAAWRGRERPSDPPARATHAFAVLRELRLPFWQIPAAAPRDRAASRGTRQPSRPRRHAAAFPKSRRVGDRRPRRPMPRSAAPGSSPAPNGPSRPAPVRRSVPAADRRTHRRPAPWASRVGGWPGPGRPDRRSQRALPSHW
jgi:hypothetical protein